MPIKSIKFLLLSLLLSMTACDKSDDIIAPDGGDDVEEIENPVVTVEPLPDDERPILTDGKAWLYERFKTGDTPNPTQFKKSVYGDTIVRGINAKKMAINDVYQSGPYSIPVLSAEVDGMLYELDMPLGWDPTGESYDWALQLNMHCDQGYQIATSYPDIRIPLSRGTIVLMGKTRRAIKVWCQDSFISEPYIDYWVEGIGAILQCEKLCYDTYKPSGPYNRYRSRLLECYDGDEKIYDYQEFNHDLYIPDEILNPEPSIE